MIRIGNQFGDEIIWNSEEPEKVMDSEGIWNWTFSGYCKAEVAESQIPPYRSLLTEGSTQRLMEASILPRTDAPGMVDVKLFYRNATSDSGGGGGDTISTHTHGETEIETHEDWREIPIEDPSLVESGFITAEQRDALKKLGIKTKGIGGIEYSFTEFIKDFTYTETALLASDIGKTGAPPGLGGASADKWLLASVSISSDGVTLEEEGEPEEGEPPTTVALAEITRHTQIWRYSAVGWESTE